jgi:hypothetical protein
MNAVHISDLNHYPYYLYEYFYTMVRVPLMFHLFVVILYVRNKEMRKTVARELQTLLMNAIYDQKTICSTQNCGPQIN